MTTELSKTASLTPEGINDWLNSNPPESEIEWKESVDDKGKPIMVSYIPGWRVEELLWEYCKLLSSNTYWERSNHKYSFVEISNFMHLATSHELYIQTDNHMYRFLCGSCIKLADFPNNSNWIQTGITEATKAGVKTIGNRFGASLNDRKILNVPVKKPIEPIPEEMKNRIPAGLREKLTQS